MVYICDIKINLFRINFLNKQITNVAFSPILHVDKRNG